MSEHHLDALSDGHVALVFAQEGEALRVGAVDEQGAVEVVRFVLHDRRRDPLPFEAQRLARAIEGLDADPARPPHPAPAQRVRHKTDRLGSLPGFQKRQQFVPSIVGQIRRDEREMQ